MLKRECAIFKHFVKVLKNIFKGPTSARKTSIKRSTSQTRFSQKTKTLKKKKVVAPKRRVVHRPLKKKKGPEEKPKGAVLQKTVVNSKAKVKKTAAVKKVVPELYVGEITHYFQKISVVVVKVVEHPILIGDLIHIKGSTTDFSQKVNSLQVESNDVRFARKGELVGLQVVEPAKPGDKLYKIKK